MPKISQDNRRLRITTPLGRDVLIPVSMVGEEEVSRPFLYAVDLVSENLSITPEDLLGEAVTLHIALLDGGERQRPIHGHVRRVVSTGIDQGKGTFALARYR